MSVTSAGYYCLTEDHAHAFVHVSSKPNTLRLSLKYKANTQTAKAINVDVMMSDVQLDE